MKHRLFGMGVGRDLIYRDYLQILRQGVLTTVCKQSTSMKKNTLADTVSLSFFIGNR